MQVNTGFIIWPQHTHRQALTPAATLGRAIALWRQRSTGAPGALHGRQLLVARDAVCGRLCGR
ncbi:MAG: hypothetical protein NTV49_11575 [Kiritimatiellaeota bacterium]|nr:hypothetical protein [Kiritimatiellota bacterium]